VPSTSHSTKDRSLSAATPVTVMVPDTIALLAGEVIATAGGVLSTT
jgi:hypothetical protein